MSNPFVDHLALLGIQRLQLRKQTSVESFAAESSSINRAPNQNVNAEINAQCSLITIDSLLFVCFHETASIEGLGLMQDIARTLSAVSVTPNIIQSNHLLMAREAFIQKNIAQILTSAIEHHSISCVLIAASELSNASKTILQKTISTIPLIFMPAIDDIKANPTLKKSLWRELSSYYIP